MNAKILLISRAGEETNTLKRELKRQETYSVDLATTPNQAIDTITQDRVDLVIFNTEIFTKKKLQLSNDIKELGQNFPVLILANSVMADTFHELEKTMGTVFLEKPFDIKDLFGLTEKLVGGRDVHQRIFRRFQTNQEASFARPPAMDLETTIRIRNLSQGGAYFEYEGRPNVTVGDQIFMDIPLQQLSRRYRMKAKVVWTTPPTAIGRNGLGVEFVR
jgi:DNA-binding NtrC family response regulator